MFLIIAGCVIVGAVGLAALYDYISKRRGRDIEISASGPMTPTIDQTHYHEDGWTGP
jgi:hypothetical protein